ncbi:coiled-coil domain-containing protein 106-like [Labeo rohita]|uniref:Coiled-coil domain-containing protein 106-like n=1 Tax=Labeo rohita TaxID=84645 RepID=A0A498NAD0_LABRO|nr:coiled-coil domain-containing protein 106-like [Labeo rohita]RXN37736.1 coiled-coil domain-containing protein 106-like [Labeo rohita]
METGFSKGAHGGGMEAKEGILELAKLKEQTKMDRQNIEHLEDRIKYLEETNMTTTDGIIRRYKNALKRFTKFGSMKKAFTKINVDRNTIARTAIIAELAITYPDTFKELLPTDDVNEKISEFVERCRRAITKEMTETIAAKKNVNSSYQ